MKKLFNMNSNKEKLKIICVIPARGGSKGLKNKNLRKVCDKPLIYYPIADALKSNLFDHIFVSTDSENIAKTSKKYGASVPFLRPKKFAKDLSSTEDTLKYALLSFERYVGYKFDICVYLTANRIFRKAKWINISINNLINDDKIDTSFPVQKIYANFWHEKNGKYRIVLPWMKNYTSRQVAPNFYREDTGLVCATRAKFWRKGKRVGKNIKFIFHNYNFSEIDIHSKEDLYIADMAMKYLLENTKK